MKYNIEGFGYDIVWVGDNSEEQTSPQAQKEYVKLFNFFDSINEDEGYTKIAVKKREDLETVGCAAFEAIRARNKQLFAMYHAPIINIPLAAPFYRDWETDRKSTRLNSSHSAKSRMPSSA